MKNMTALGIVAGGTAINTVSAVQKSKDPFPTIIGGIAFGTICVGINALTKSSVGTLLAVLFLLSSFLTNGVKFLETLEAVINSPEPGSPGASGTFGSGGGSGFTSPPKAGSGVGGSSSGSF